MDAFIYTLIDMSLVSVYCILVVLLLRLFLRKAPKTFSYLLWAVVFLRLILPVFPEAPVSLVPEALSVARSSQILAPSSVNPAEVAVPETAASFALLNETSEDPAEARQNRTLTCRSPLQARRLYRPGTSRIRLFPSLLFLVYRQDRSCLFSGQQVSFSW